jgi:opacity protein-like surface antigen
VENQFAHDLFFSVTQSLSKNTILQLAYDYNRISGFQANPFLRTLVNSLMVVGTTPDLRSRQAVVVRLRQALPRDTYLQVDYRRYFDSWSLSSNTLSLGVDHYFTPALMAGFTYRWYDQTGAYFYQPFYTGNPLYYTGDFRLQPFNAGTYTGHVVFTPAHRIFDLLPDKTAFDLQYDRYRANTQFGSAMFTLGLRIPF